MLVECTYVISATLLKQFYTTFHNIRPLLSPVLVICSDSLPLLPISDLDIQKAPPPEKNRPSTCVGLLDMPGFIIKGSSTVLVSVLQIYLQSVFQKLFPAQWKQAVIVLVYKKGSNACVHNYRLTSLFSNFSKV